MWFWLLACFGDSVGVHNNPPELSIVSPADFDTFTEGFTVLFEVIVSDDQTPVESMTTFWVSDLDGEMEGTTVLDQPLVFESEPLSEGEHQIKLLVTDTSGGVGETGIVLTIQRNQAPELSFIHPPEDAVYAEDVLFRATLGVVDNTEPDVTAITLSWSLDGESVEGPENAESDGTAEFEMEGIALGEHTLAVSAMDSPGKVAELTLNFALVEPDADGDGYETDRLGGEDCDDEDPAIHPGALEVCDDLDTDEDCSGFADDADLGVTDQALLYLDADGDGYGDMEIVTCEADAGVVDDGDCDDRDATVNPGTPEICNDGKDNDCDGTSNHCRLEGSLDLYAADVLYYGEDALDGLGSAVAVGDLDGDGLAELALGVPLHDGVDSDSGSVFVVPGAGFGEIYLDTASTALTGTSEQDHAGESVVVLEDMNGDGFGEVLLGAPRQDSSGTDAGMAYLLYGPFTSDRSLSGADALLYGEDEGDLAGSSVGAAGDVDGDGVPDLLIGAEDEDSAEEEGGAGYLFLGPVSGSISMGDANGKFRAEEATDHLGVALTGVGDTNDDGYDDMLIGAVGQDEAGNDAGAAYLVLGDTTGIWSNLSLRMSAADAKLLGDEAGVGAGQGLHGPGDLDGDGRTDLVIGAWGADNEAGRVFLVHGPVNGTVDLGSVATSTWLADSTEAWTGYGVTSGDFDADGEQDLLFGAPKLNTGSTEAGTAWLLYGPWGTGELDLSNVADGWVDGSKHKHAMGTAVAAGDVDGDGKDDMILGVPNDDSSANNAGMVTVIWGRGL